MARPRDTELDRREQVFRESFLAGATITGAMAAARMDEKHFIRLIEDAEWAGLILAVSERRRMSRGEPLAA